jgi:hypothetical protein
MKMVRYYLPRQDVVQIFIVQAPSALLDMRVAHGAVWVDRCTFDCHVIPAIESHVVDRFVRAGSYAFAGPILG